MRAYRAAPFSGEPAFANPESDLAAGLDDALAAKLIDVLRSRRHHFMARREGPVHAVELFLAHSNAAQDHADRLAGLLLELGAEPRFSPQLLARNRAGSLTPAAELRVMAEDDLEATHATDAALRALLPLSGAADSATRRVLLGILAADRIRAKELAALIAPRARRA